MRKSQHTLVFVQQQSAERGIYVTKTSHILTNFIPNISALNSEHITLLLRIGRPSAEQTP